MVTAALTGLGWAGRMTGSSSSEACGLGCIILYNIIAYWFRFNTNLIKHSIMHSSIYCINIINGARYPTWHVPGVTNK